jgi:glycosyltransferase involved in cell wall biosynthesis
VAGADVCSNYQGRADTVAVRIDDEMRPVAMVDFEVVERVVDRLRPGWTRIKMLSAGQMLEMVRQASLMYDQLGDERSSKRGVAMLKDRSGAGHWRMVFPARYMDKADSFVDVTAAGIRIESLMEYETVFVQRLHDWESYYMLERLKSAGKRIVYDIDDDIFHIDKDNPAASILGRDEQMAAVECMRLADAVTTTVEPLREIVREMTGTVEAVVIPNAVDMDDGWRSTPMTGSPDEWKRIFWQGGDTHGEDWNECVDAVDALMGERDDLRVVILGYLPPIVISILGRVHWKGRVEFLEFNSPETYFAMMKHVRAEVGLAPLRSTMFTQSKSPLKFIEYAAIGMPTVASNERPYADAIKDGEDGYLVRDSQGWFDSISLFLDDKRRRQAVLEKARRKVREIYNIRKTAVSWKAVLLP